LYHKAVFVADLLLLNWQRTILDKK